MSCDHSLVIEHINDYLENRLSPELKQQMDKTIHSCPDCQITHKQCIEMYQMSYDWQAQNVPEWHRTHYAVRPPLKSSNWINWGSMATSTFAILMVIFQLEVTNSDSGLMISFGGNQTESKIAQLVESQLANYKTKQDLLFKTKLSNALEQQEIKTKLRLANWLEKNRDERQQDIQFVMTGWQSQRYEDQKDTDRRFAYIADNQIENNQVINQLVRSVSQRKSARLKNKTDL